MRILDQYFKDQIRQQNKTYQSAVKDLSNQSEKPPALDHYISSAIVEEDSEKHKSLADEVADEDTTTTMDGSNSEFTDRRKELQENITQLETALSKRVE